MGGGVDLLELSDADLGVDLGGREFDVTEHLLDEPDVRPPSSIKVAMVWRNRWQEPRQGKRIKSSGGKEDRSGPMKRSSACL